jgi:hypothetical protein
MSRGPFPWYAADIKPKRGKRKLYTHSGPYNMPARYVRIKGFSGLSVRTWSSRTLWTELDAMHRNFAQRAYGERGVVHFSRPS